MPVCVCVYTKTEQSDWISDSSVKGASDTGKPRKAQTQSELSDNKGPLIQLL